MSESASSLLNYADVKRKAISSKAIRTKIPSSNGTSFQSGQTIHIDLPANCANTFFDMSLSYIQYNVCFNGTQALATTTNTANFDSMGAYSMWQRLQILTGGSVISDLQQFNVLAGVLMDGNVNNLYKQNVGAQMLSLSNGTSDSRLGESMTIPAGAPAAYTKNHKVSCPFILNPLSMTSPHRYIPAFSRDQLRIRLTLASAQDGMVFGADALPVSNSTIGVEDVEMVVYMVELSPEAFRLVNDMCGGVYNLICNDFRNTAASLPAGNTTLVSTLGFSMSSLESMIVSHRSVSNASAVYSTLGSRSRCNLQQYQLFINGQAYPQRPVLCNGNLTDQEGGAFASELVAENLIADHSLANFDHHSSICNINGGGVNGLTIFTRDEATLSVGASDTFGTFYSDLELESLAHKSDSLYSGLDTVGSVVQYRGLYNNDTPTTNVFSVDFYARNTILLSLDTNSTNTFVVSV